MNRVVLLLPPFLLACETSQREGARPGHPSENHVPGRLDFGAFTLKTPKEWTKFTEQGIDTYVGGLTNGKDTLEFGYGWWSHMIENYDDPSSVFAADTLDGFLAIISLPKNEKSGAIEMNIDLKPPVRFTIYGNVEDIPMALSIVESIHFSSGDPSKTRPLTLDRFVSGMPPTGKAMFQVYCSECHSRARRNIGQAMSSDYVRQKGEKWIVDWLSHRPKFDKDTVNGIPCGGRTKLTSPQIKNIVDYLKS